MHYFRVFDLVLQPTVPPETDPTPPDEPDVIDETDDIPADEEPEPTQGKLF